MSADSEPVRVILFRQEVLSASPEVSCIPSTWRIVVRVGKNDISHADLNALDHRYGAIADVSDKNEVTVW